ncbi:DUF1353 domain-containing protein [Nocardia sp. NBC_01503]|uniref:DUF1353 domain-containing protein n=1 Tax=Nocardia sp. NBC_01503 TaxID=2975997 RepID=UPI002E7B27B7|nr:DUF1353 domain-containing protein [Nocardia sp. NBC_01503]WTL29185.1 DUF1353 domain-containing protein [Nocardia sp. NBC_01503]
MPFLGEYAVVVEEVDAVRWRMQVPLTYRAAADIFIVPVGFVTDFASVPRPLIWLIPRYGTYTRAAILHDYLCEHRPVGRSDADGIFRRVLRECGVSRIQRWMMWAAVRFGGRMAGANAREWLQFLLVALPTVLFLALPFLIDSLYLLLFRLCADDCETATVIPLKTAAESTVVPVEAQA